MKHELFLEVGTEELPAAEILTAVAALSDAIVKGLDDRRLGHADARTYATPRRLTVVIGDVDVAQSDLEKEVAGPPVRAGLKAAEGFARGLGLDASKLYVKTTAKGEYLHARVTEVGRRTHELLPDLLASAIAAIPFARAMRWGYGEQTFSRPVQWIASIFGGEIVRFRFADVESSNRSFGHRFLSPRPFEVSGEAHYLGELSQRHVVPEVRERRRRIEAEAARLAETIGGRVRPDDELLDEVTQLVEWPVAMLCEFDSRFLEIPQAVLISEMREHQRYLAIVDASGKLLPYFVVIANTNVKDPRIVLSGYRRVLTARFSDGAFFFTEDKKKRLVDRVEDLKSLQFHRALGSTYDRSARIVRNAAWLARTLSTQIGEPIADVHDAMGFALGPTPERDLFTFKLLRSAALAKADLLTRMVFEFPDLQGEMGCAYARASGEPEEVARAIEEHYLPRGASDDLPKGTIGALVGLADRLDTIAGIFSVQKGPTGAADPYGLRRAAIGILRVLDDRRWHLSLSRSVDQAIHELGARRARELGEVTEGISEFFRARTKAQLLAQGVSADVAEAALAAGHDDPVDAMARARALATLRGGAGFEPLAIAVKRVSNIMKGQDSSKPLDLETLRHPAERALADAATSAVADVRAALDARDFPRAFSRAAELRPAVDSFFEAVLVMDPNPDVRASRLALLAQVHAVFAPLADFTKLS
ncbi:MAG: glycine--tRNA ligase subunit beta [Deltaproteobacteria bacterium]|nr:glycine--tRNA ligase subunit beta [Deltaproteobacteria bacterium]